MTDETIEATILNLRAKALEVFGLMKEMAQRPSAEGDVTALSQYSAQLAQLEGALITLQQYTPVLKETRDTPAPEPEDDPPEEEPTAISGEMLAARSPTFRRSQLARRTQGGEDE